MIRASRLFLEVYLFLALAGVGASLATGTVEVWGDQLILPPDTLGDVVEIASSGSFNLALKADGSLIAWGDNVGGQCEVPVSAEEFVEIAAGFGHGLAVTESGSIVAQWFTNFL